MSMPFARTERHIEKKIHFSVLCGSATSKGPIMRKCERKKGRAIMSFKPVERRRKERKTL
jgi:hypothetical protein